MLAFSCLPTELQLEVLEKCDSRSLTHMLQTDRATRLASFYTLNHKINELLGLSRTEVAKNENESQINSSPSSNLYISLYSPQQANRKKEFYETKCITSVSSSKILSRNESTTDLTILKAEPSVSGDAVDSEFMDNVIDKLKTLELNQETSTGVSATSGSASYNDQKNQISVYQTTALQNNTIDSLVTTVQLGKLKGFKDPLKFTDELITESEESKDTHLEDQKNLHILIDEESTTFKIHFEILLRATDLESNQEKMTKLATDSKRISIFSEQGTISTEDNSINVSYRLIKGEENPPKGPYDYTIMTNYYIQFESFQINNSYLLHCCENADI